jgi:hypothetical protein
MFDISKINYHQTDTWPKYNKLCEEEDEIIVEFIKEIYCNGVFAEIERLMNSNEFPKCSGIGHIVLIAICSVIDSLSAYANANDGVGVRYKGFIKNYFPEEYRGSEEGIYDVFRCDGVHGWNLHRSMISGERNDRNHLNNKEGILYLSLYDFFDDLQDAFNNYLNQLVKDKELINNLLNRYKEIRVVVDKIMDNHYTG